MRILVTGSGGFIGRELLDFFLNDGVSVIATYRNTKPEVPDISSKKIELVRLDLSVDNLEKIGAVDVIVHAAAHTHLIPDSTAYDYNRSNVVATLNLADYAKTLPPKLFIYLSSFSVYGDITTGELDEDTLFNKPQMYGVSKFMCEHILREHSGYFPSVCIRLPGVVGKGSFVPWLGKILRKAGRNEPIQIYNSDSLFNNVVDVTELHRFISLVIKNGFDSFEYVNLAASEPIMIREVIDIIISLTESRSEIIKQETRRQSFYVKTDKVRRIFGFEPEITKIIISRYVKESIPYL